MSELRFLPAVFDDTAEAARWYDEEGQEAVGRRQLAVSRKEFRISECGFELRNEA